MTDVTWINASLTAARPQAIGALLRYFRDLDTAEEAFQEACLRALQHWPRNRPPRDPASWLILVGRNAGLDGARRRSRLDPLPSDDAISDLDDVETPLAERLDISQYRDDVLRLLFIYFHFFGAKGAFLLQLGRANEARVAFDQAIALARTPAQAAHIRQHLDRLLRESSR